MNHAPHLHNLQLDSLLRRHLRQIWSIPMLDEDEEHELGIRWRDHHDQSALDRLVNSHLRLAAKIAMGYRGYGLPVADLISEGSLGLMQAARRFDPDHGARLASYAKWWIRAAIHAYVFRSWSVVSIVPTVSQRKLFFRLRGLKAFYHTAESGDMSPEDVARIAKELGVAAAEVVSMNRRLAGADYSLNAPFAVGEETGEWQDRLPDEGDGPEVELAERQNAQQRSRLLEDAVARLDPRARAIFVERQLSEKPRTLDELAAAYDISAERISQIEKRAIEKVRRAINAQLSQARQRRADDREGFALRAPANAA
jgi:RNA polymerase sigma-32 factor